MSEIVILNFSPSYQDQVSEIFFESSTKKEFKNQKEKDDFFWKYVGFYLSHYPNYAWIAVQDSKVLGYVLGMSQTVVPELYAIQPHLRPFEEHFESYPAHLHINCHAEARGKGVGSRLVKKLLEQMKNEKVSGLHIMTGPASDNKVFYQKLGFDFEVEIQGILLMGVRI